MPTNGSVVSISDARSVRKFAPSISRVIASGRDTWNSYPSRRIVSIRIDRCSSPRPETAKTRRLVRSIPRATRDWFPARGRAARATGARCENFASRPAYGEVLTPNVKLQGRLFDRNRGEGSGADGSAMVAPILASAKPADRHDITSAGFVDLAPFQARRTSRAGDMRCRTAAHRRDRFAAAMSPAWIVPRWMRPIAIRDRWVS